MAGSGGVPAINSPFLRGLNSRVHVSVPLHRWPGFTDAALLLSRVFNEIKAFVVTWNGSEFSGGSAQSRAVLDALL